MTGGDYRELADPARSQYFLSAPDKLEVIRSAADVRESDDVIELGAGVGTVARSLPPSRSLTVVELDPRLAGELRRAVPHATVLTADGVALLREHRVSADVIISNLPWSVTEGLIAILPTVRFRTAVLAVGSVHAFAAVADQISHEYLASVTGDDFVPPQPGTSYLVRAKLRDDRSAQEAV